MAENTPQKFEITVEGFDLEAAIMATIGGGYNAVVSEADVQTYVDLLTERGLTESAQNLQNFSELALLRYEAIQSVRVGGSSYLSKLVDDRLYRIAYNYDDDIFTEQNLIDGTFPLSDADILNLPQDEQIQAQIDKVLFEKTIALKNIVEENQVYLDDARTRPLIEDKIRDLLNIQLETNVIPTQEMQTLADKWNNSVFVDSEGNEYSYSGDAFVFLDDENRQDRVTEETLAQDPDFLKALRNLYTLDETGITGTEAVKRGSRTRYVPTGKIDVNDLSDEQLADWGIQYFSKFENRLTDTLNVGAEIFDNPNATDEQKIAFIYGYERFINTQNNFGTAMRALGYGVSDPITLGAGVVITGATIATTPAAGSGGAVVAGGVLAGRQALFSRFTSFMAQQAISKTAIAGFAANTSLSGFEGYTRNLTTQEGELAAGHRETLSHRQAIMAGGMEAAASIFLDAGISVFASSLGRMMKHAGTTNTVSNDFTTLTNSLQDLKDLKEAENVDAAKLETLESDIQKILETGQFNSDEMDIIDAELGTLFNAEKPVDNTLNNTDFTPAPLNAPSVDVDASNITATYGGSIDTPPARVVQPEPVQGVDEAVTPPAVDTGLSIKPTEITLDPVQPVNPSVVLDDAGRPVAVIDAPNVERAAPVKPDAADSDIAPVTLDPVLSSPDADTFVFNPDQPIGGGSPPVGNNDLNSLSWDPNQRIAAAPVDGRRGPGAAPVNPAKPDDVPEIDTAAPVQPTDVGFVPTGFADSPAQTVTATYGPITPNNIEKATPVKPFRRPNGWTKKSDAEKADYVQTKLTTNEARVEFLTNMSQKESIDGLFSELKPSVQAAYLASLDGTAQRALILDMPDAARAALTGASEDYARLVNTAVAAPVAPTQPVADVAPTPVHTTAPPVVEPVEPVKASTTTEFADAASPDIDDTVKPTVEPRGATNDGWDGDGWAAQSAKTPEEKWDWIATQYDEPAALNNALNHLRKNDRDAFNKIFVHADAQTQGDYLNTLTPAARENAIKGLPDEHQQAVRDAYNGKEGPDGDGATKKDGASNTVDGVDPHRDLSKWVDRWYYDRAKNRHDEITKILDDDTKTSSMSRKELRALREELKSLDKNYITPGPDNVDIQWGDIYAASREGRQEGNPFGTYTGPDGRSNMRTLFRYVMDMGKEAKALSKSQNISLEEAKNKIAESFLQKLSVASADKKIDNELVADFLVMARVNGFRENIGTVLKKEANRATGGQIHYGFDQHVYDTVVFPIIFKRQGTANWQDDAAIFSIFKTRVQQFATGFGASDGFNPYRQVILRRSIGAMFGQHVRSDGSLGFSPTSPLHALKHWGWDLPGANLWKASNNGFNILKWPMRVAHVGLVAGGYTAAISSYANQTDDDPYALEYWGGMLTRTSIELGTDVIGAASDIPVSIAAGAGKILEVTGAIDENPIPFAPYIRNEIIPTIKGEEGWVETQTDKIWVRDNDGGDTITPTINNGSLFVHPGRGSSAADAVKPVTPVVESAAPPVESAAAKPPAKAATPPAKTTTPTKPAAKGDIFDLLGAILPKDVANSIENSFGHGKTSAFFNSIGDFGKSLFQNVMNWTNSLSPNMKGFALAGGAIVAALLGKNLFNGIRGMLTGKNLLSTVVTGGLAIGALHLFSRASGGSQTEVQRPARPSVRDTREFVVGRESEEKVSYNPDVDGAAVLSKISADHAFVGEGHTLPHQPAVVQLAALRGGDVADAASTFNAKASGLTQARYDFSNDTLAIDAIQGVGKDGMPEQYALVEAGWVPQSSLVRVGFNASVSEDPQDTSAYTAEAAAVIGSGEHVPNNVVDFSTAVLALRGRNDDEVELSKSHVPTGMQADTPIISYALLKAGENNAEIRISSTSGTGDMVAPEAANIPERAPISFADLAAEPIVA